MTAAKILIILFDDLGWGNVSQDMPKLRDFMAQSVVYRNAHAPVSWCAPTRWAIMTGRYPHTRSNPITNPPVGKLIGATTRTLPKSLKAAGYATGIFGKWHLGGNPLDYGFQTGRWYQTADSALESNPVKLFDDRTPITRSPAQALPAIVNRAVDFMATPGPWFAYVALPTPHKPYLTGDYRSWVRAGDDALQVLVEAAGPDALIIVTSDNGTLESAGIAHAVPNPNRGWKQSLFDGGTRVPFAIRHPDIEPGETDQLVGLLDLYSTIGSVVGFVGHPDSVDIFGVGREYLITQDLARRLAVRNAAGWKLHLAASLLYHLPTDPREESPRDEPTIEEELRNQGD